MGHLQSVPKALGLKWTIPSLPRPLNLCAKLRLSKKDYIWSKLVTQIFRVLHKLQHLPHILNMFSVL